MSEQQSEKASVKDWITFLSFVIVILTLGFFIGFPVGQKYPTSDVKLEWLSSVRKEVDGLKNDYQGIIAIQDSIIYQLKREIINLENQDHNGREQ